MKVALTIAGSDSSGGAGIQADLKTFTVHRVFGMSVITAITAQNTLGVTAVQTIDKDVVAKQLDAVFSDIKPDAVKIGMVSSVEVIDVIVDKLKEYHIKNVVLDTVMVSTSGHRLIDEEAEKALIEKLMPLSTVITPNLPEAERICGFEIRDNSDMIIAAEAISKCYKGVILIKGGHFEETDRSDDLIYQDGKVTWLKTDRIDNPNTHGTGCTLSSAIASNLAKGESVEGAIKKAKDFVYNAINAKLDLGGGRGPLNHFEGIK